MSVMFFDIGLEVKDKVDDKLFFDIDFHNLLYADDTLIIGKRAREVNIILKAIEKHSSRYGLRLNKKKCNHINMNCKANIKFSDDTEMNRVEEAEYLGAKMTKKHISRTELENRLAKALLTAKNLKNLQDHRVLPKIENSGV